MVGREIEIKHVVTDPSLCQRQVDIMLETLLAPFDTIEGESDDSFFLPPPSGVADFVRLREFENGTAELTFKKKDRRTNFNRIEENVRCESADEAKMFAYGTFGDPISTLTKRYTVHFVERDLEVSTYVVQGDNRLFLEVEGPTEEAVTKLSNRIASKIALTQEPRSLFEIFVEPKIASYKVIKGGINA